MAKTENMTDITFEMDQKTRDSCAELCDENGFTPAQAAELQKRIDEIENANVIRHNLIGK